MGLLAYPRKIAAEGIELNGGYADVTRDFGLDGFDVETALWVSPRIAITADYDDVYDTSRFGAFEFTGLYPLNPHWTARLNLNLRRTHLNSQGQSRLRFGLGVAYTFGSTEVPSKGSKEKRASHLAHPIGS